MSSENKKAGIEPKVFFPPLIIVVSFCAIVMFNLDEAKKILNVIFGKITLNFGWAFEWYWVVMIVLWLWFLLGPLAKKKIGEGKPEFSTFTWMFLMFASGTSAVVLFWMTMEPYYYIMNPPFGYEAQSLQAKEIATAYSMLHWGPITWLSYCPLIIAFAYFFFVKKINVVRPSGTLGPVIGEKNANGLLGAVIDNLYIMAFILAIGTSLGTCTPLVTEAMNYLFGIERTLGLDIALVAVWVVFNAVCVAFGLSKGIKTAGDVRTFLTLMLCAWILISGSTIFLLNYFTDSLGVFLNNLPRMLFYTDMIGESKFPQSWTIFYWAWYIVFGIQSCIFYARISKGRTVREICFGVAGGMCLSTFFIIMTFGGNTVDAVNRNVVDIAYFTKLIEEGREFRCVVELVATLPLSTVAVGIFFVLCLVATLTLVNANSYTMAMSTCKSESAEAEPPLFARVLWSVIVGAIGIVLVAMKGIKPIQTLMLVGGIPLFFVNLMVIYAFFKDALGPNGLWRKDVIKDEETKA